MPQNDLEFKVKISSDINESIKELEQLYKRFDQSKALKGNSKSILSTNFEKLKYYQQQTSLSKGDSKEFSRIINQIINELDKNLPNFKTLNDEQRKLIETLSTKRKELSQLVNKRNELKSSGKTDFTKQLGDIRLFKKTKDGTKLSKRPVTNPDTIFKNLEEGTEFYTADGKPWDATAFKQAYKSALEAQAEYAKLSQKITLFKKEISALNQQISKSTVTNTDNSEVTDALSLFDKTTNAVDKQNAQFSQEEGRINAQRMVDEANINKTTIAIQKQQNALNKAFKTITLYAIALRTLKSALREAVQTISQLDKELTEQAMVTGLTREQTYGLIQDYQRLAVQTGATTKEIASVATEYMKQGKSIQDSLVLTEAAVAAAKVARVSVGDSVNYLTTALNGFQLAAEEAMRVSDKFAAVAAASASDYDELAIALSKVASQANLAGMSIDYTTALLTKGLETTREAPETMGTALKTIIARMREMSDYGETLEGDTDVNNVETQLAYVGIALKDANGELRSTQDVLDELGRKWDTLNKNQQAALAKALAGTRQQSRLIALMDDYERVIELQQISERSAGATSAQASVYLEGIEASLNGIRVAWEKIVTSLTNSEVIISVLNIAEQALTNIGGILSTTAGQIALFSTVGLMIANILSKKALENQIAKENIKLQQQQTILQLKQRNEELLRAQLIKMNSQLTDAEVDKILAAYHAQVALNKAKQQEKRIQAGQINAKNTGASDAAKAEALQQQADATIQMADAQKALLTGNDAASKEYQNNLRQINLLSAEQNNLLSQSVLWLGLATTAQSLFNIVKTVYNVGVAIGNKLRNKEIAGHVANTAATNAETAATWSLVAAKAALDPFGAIAVAVAAALVAVAGGLAAFFLFTDRRSQVEKTADAVKDLSNQIFTLSQKSTELNKVVSSFDDLDNKLFKTSEDLDEMNSLLDSAADKLTEDEKERYNQLTTAEQRRQFLADAAAQAEEEANKKRQEQINLLRALSSEERNVLLTNSKYAEVQSAVYAANNAELYNLIDNQKELGKLNDDTARSFENIGQAILENMSASEAYQASINGTVNAILQDLMSLEKVLTENGEFLSLGEILESSDATLQERVNAFKAIADALKDDTASYNAFIKAYNSMSVFAEMSEDTLEFIDTIGLTEDKLNELYLGWQKLQKAGLDITQQEYESMFETILNTLADTNGDIEYTMNTIFGSYLAAFEEGTAEWNAAWDSVIGVFGELVSVGILNMGQNIDKLKNTINQFYETAQEWSSMSETDKTQFISDNAELFAGSSGESLLKAFESGDYNKIEEALRESENLQKIIEQRLKEVNQEIAYEEAKSVDSRNEAYLQQLREYKKYLENSEELFKASLEVRLEQEQKQLDQYKSYLEQEKEALEDSLEKRKEAYEKYFEDINQDAEDNEFEKNYERITSNLTRISVDSSANARNAQAELMQQLAELEEERLKELRERAQEELLNSLDTEVTQINEKFDKLLNSQQALLMAMTQDLKDPAAFITKLIQNQMNTEGLTALGLENYLQELMRIYSPSIGQEAFDNIAIREDNNNLYLTVNGEEVINLSSADQSSLYETIKKALAELGYR